MDFDRCPKSTIDKAPTIPNDNAIFVEITDVIK